MAPSADEVLDVDRLRELALSGAGEAVASPLHACPYLLLDLDTAIGPDAPALVAWLNRQPCPVIGISSGPVAPTWLDGCDLVSGSQEELTVIKKNIRSAPLAAMTLVQVLRMTERLAPAQALTVESLAYATLQSGPEFAAWLRQHPPEPGRPQPDAGREPAVLLQRQGAELGIQLNRPEYRNAMSIEMRDALAEALEVALADTTIERIRFSGAGACFSVGGELREFGGLPDPAQAHAIRSIRLPAAQLIRCAERAEFHLHGACIGAGVELPAFGRQVIADKRTFFQLPEIRFGLLPGAGGCVGIPRRIGRRRAAWLALSARRINAATALEWGLVDAVSG